MVVMVTTANFVVVGGGTAGSVLAARLSEDPGITVCLIEAGSADLPDDARDPLRWPALPGGSIDWTYRTIPQRHCGWRVHDWPRGKVLGGSSAINAMAYMRGHPADFDAWNVGGVSGWGFRELLPYFIRAETSPIDDGAPRGTTGPIQLLRPDKPHPLVLSFIKAAEENGLAPTMDHNGHQMAGPTLNTLMIRDGVRQTTADAYLTEAVRARANLTIVTDAEVETLRFERGACRSVEMRRAGSLQSVAATKAVVLCAGAIGSPLLLQRSGIGPGDALKAAGVAPHLDLPGVGRNLHDHLLAGGNLYRAARPVPPSRYQHSESMLYVHLNDDRPTPDIAVACVVAPVVTEQFEAPPYGSAYTLMFGATHPRSRGKIAITSPDPDEMPRIDPAYLSDPHDRATALAAMDWARRLGHSAALSEWRGEELLPTTEDLRSEASREAFLERAAYTHHHPVGTCRMGRDADAVVGADLKVTGTDNLYVVDASVMPAITTGPVIAAVIAIAEKAADMLAGRTLLAPLDVAGDAHA